MEPITPKPSTLREFPESEQTTEGMFVLPADFTHPSCRIEMNVEYAVKDGMPLHLEIIRPWPEEEEPDRTYPLILFVQGSGWEPQTMGLELPQLGRFAARGFVIAVVEYRPANVAPIPAQIKDLKTAARFLQAHADEYAADPAQLILWGDSSGGHTAVMAALTQSLAEFDDEDPAAFPLDVKALVDYYAPVDLLTCNNEPCTIDHGSADSLLGRALGGLGVTEHPEVGERYSPIWYVTPENPIPPVFILHGGRDRLIPLGQSVRFYEALTAAGKEAEFYKLTGADHGGAPFWSEGVFDLLEEFLWRALEESQS